jgi:hypothetical protein
MRKILQALDGASTKPVDGSNDMAKFLSIVDNNASTKVLNEGANPHKVTLPVQMAMQHYNKPVVTAPKKESLLKKYFVEAESVLEEERQADQMKIKQYSQKIASKVLMRESKLRDKEDLQAKRKALQDIQLDPNTSKDSQLKAELARRKAALEKEAVRRGLSEGLAPEQLQKLAGLKKRIDADNEAKRAADMAMTPDKQAEVDSWAQDFQKNTASKLGKQVVAPAVPTPVTSKPEENLSLAELQTRLTLLMKIEKLLMQKDKLMARAEKFPGGIERGLASDLEMDYGSVENWDTKDYQYALQGFQQQVEKLHSYIDRKRAAWRKPKARYMENAPAGNGVREESVIRQEIAKWQQQLDVLEVAFHKARKITTEIKYDDTAITISSRVRELIKEGMHIDVQDFEYAQKDVQEAQNKLEAAIYALDDVFSDAVRNVKYQIEELESEIDDIHDAQRYARADESKKQGGRKV